MRAILSVLCVLLLLLMMQNVHSASDIPTCPLGLFFDDLKKTCLPCSKATSETCVADTSCSKAGFEFVNDTLCLPIQTCPEGQYKNAEILTCKPCSQAKTSEECDLCPTYQFDAEALTCDAKPSCNETAYWDTTGNECFNCAAEENVLETCQKTYACPFFYFDTSCKPCSEIDLTDPDGIPNSNAECACLTDYFWNVTQQKPLCAPCSNANENECYLCKGYFFNSTSSKCRICQSVKFSAEIYNDQIGGCQCFPGYVWNHTSHQCVPCSTTTEKQSCSSSKCAGFVFSKDVCVECAQDENDDPALNSQFYGNTSCGCKNLYTWDSQNNKCGLCQDSADKQTCGTGTCSDYIFTDKCTSACSGTNVDNISSVINGTCDCLAKYVWDKSKKECGSCFQAKTAEECSKSSCSQFWWDQESGKCISCKDVPHASITEDLADEINYLQGESCTCLPDYEFSIYTKKCVPCSNVYEQSCGFGMCNQYYFSKSCKKCPKGVLPRDGKTPANACKCDDTKSQVWNVQTAKCVPCNFTQGYAMDNSTGKCANCSADPYSKIHNLANVSKITSNYSCLCRSNYQFIKGKCTCNNSALLFDIGDGAGCGNCTVIAGGTGYNKTTMGCNCVNGSYWMASKMVCICNNTGEYLVKNKCTPCLSLGRGLTTGRSLTNPIACACASDLKWSSAQKTCICGDPQSIWNSIALKCQKCDDKIHYSNKTRSTRTSCFCNDNMIWDAANFKCICNTKSIKTKDKDLSNNCKLCNTTGTTGNRTNQTACACKTGWKWSEESLKCGCSSTNCSCPANSILYKQFCEPCSSVTVRSTGKSTNNTACECKKGFYWNQTDFTCSCNISKAIYSSIKNVCNTCDIYFNANITTSSIKNFYCTCVTNYVWNATSLACQFSTTPTNKKILSLNGSFVTCANGQLDNYNCKCSPGQIWDDYNNVCIKCSVIPFANQTASASGTKYFCVCNTGYFWDVISLSCKPKCKFPVTDARCSYCLKHAGVKVNAALQSVSLAQKLWMGSGDAKFSQMVGSASEMYKLYSSLKCVCTTGYSWNQARKRCFKTAANATY